MTFREIENPSRLFLWTPETVECNPSDFGLKALMKNEFDNLDTAV